MTKRRAVFVHTSPAAIPPLAGYYKEAAPEIEVTNLLDDGVMRFFSSGDGAAAEDRLAAMLATAREVYGAEAALLTCSAVTPAMLESLRARAGIPVLKIDEPMAAAAVRAGRRLGVVVTFPPTLETTSRLIESAAEEAGVAVEIEARVLPDAYQALLAGDAARHDDLLLAAMDELALRGVDAIVLAQVSMARVVGRAVGRYRFPVFTSLETSLAAVRGALS